MSRSTIHQQLFINDGLGNRLPIQTGTWVSQAINIDEQRRISITIGCESATGAAADMGGFTGTLLVQGTNELAQCNGATGTQEAGGTSRPGINGFTGARYWTTLASGSFNITNSSPCAGNALLISFTDVGVSFIRLAFNQSATGTTATGTLGGSGTLNVYVTAKNP